VRDRLAAREKLAERGVALILARRCEHDFTIAREPQSSRAVALVGHRKPAHLKVVSGCHADLQPGFDPLVATVELGQMRVEHGAILVGDGPGRLSRRRPQGAGLLVGDI
jgi:hypothetical protein